VKSSAFAEQNYRRPGYAPPVTSRWAMLGVIFLTRLSMGIQFQSIASVAPLLISDLHIGYGQVGWLMGLFMLPGAAIAYPGGMLGRRFGERRLVLLGLALMTVGGLATALSAGFALAAAGRVASGTGGVLLNVMLTKMVADWFAGRELATAMSVMLTSWPVGIGLALATLGTLAGATSWRVAVHLTVVATAIAFVLMLALYRDPPKRDAQEAGRSALGSREIRLAVLAGLVWGIFNASYVVFLSFAPGFLVAGGASVGAAGAITSLAIWVTLASVPLGGLLADRMKRPDLLTVVGSLLAMAALLAFPYTGAPALSCFLIGVLAGAPPGAVMTLLPKALPSAGLATGLGIYYSVFYLAMTVAPGLAGMLRDRTDSAAAPIVFAGVLITVPILALAVFRQVERRPQPALVR
jgi:predicted MFS family arabinose efflux permease